MALLARHFPDAQIELAPVNQSFYVRDISRGMVGCIAATYVSQGVKWRGAGNVWNTRALEKNWQFALHRNAVAARLPGITATTARPWRDAGWFAEGKRGMKREQAEQIARELRAQIAREELQRGQRHQVVLLQSSAQRSGRRARISRSDAAPGFCGVEPRRCCVPGCRCSITAQGERLRR